VLFVNVMCCLVVQPAGGHVYAGEKPHPLSLRPVRGDGRAVHAQGLRVPRWSRGGTSVLYCSSPSFDPPVSRPIPRLEPDARYNHRAKLPLLLLLGPYRAGSGSLQRRTDLSTHPRLVLSGYSGSDTGEKVEGVHPRQATLRYAATHRPVVGGPRHHAGGHNACTARPQQAPPSGHHAHD